MTDKDHTRTFNDSTELFQSGNLIQSRYRIVRLIGAGGMGRVYQCRDEELNIDVALKLIRPEWLADEKSIERFKNEVILARKVSHKNVARIHDLGEVNGLKFLTMTYIDGKSLREVISETGPLDIDRSIRVAQQVAEGIAAAHEEGVIHRDLKPSNIMVDDQDRAYITDFGIARTQHAPDITVPGAVVGTPAYLSPEQTWGNKADQQSDIYAFGLIFYEMLAGRLPFDSGTVHSFKTKDPVDLDRLLQQTHPSVPRFVISVIQKCLSPSREARYENARSIVNDLSLRRASSTRQGSFRRVVLVLILFAAAVSAILFRDQLFRASKPPSPVRLTEPPAEALSVAVLPFINKTNDENLSWMESGIADLLITDLSQNPRLRVISADRVIQTLQDLKISAGAISDHEIKGICEILHIDYIVRGNLIRAGSAFRADAGLVPCDRPREARYLKAVGARLEDLFQISHQLSQGVHKSLPSSAPSEPLSRETESLEAWKAFQLGSALMRQGDFQKSADLFRHSIQQDPKFARAYMKLAEALEYAGNEIQALEALQRGLNQHNANPKLLDLIRTREVMLNGDLEKAIDMYRNLANKHPNDSEVLYSLAVAAEAAGDLKQAIDALEKVVQLDPNHPEAYFHLGKDTILTGDADRAISQYLLKALGISTRLNNQWNEADVLNAIGVAQERLGRYKDAVKYYEDSASIKEEIGNRKGLAVSLSNIARIHLYQGEYGKTEDILNRTTPIFEELGDQIGIADVTNMRGAIHEDQGQYEEALQYYKEALQIRKEMKNDQLIAQSYDNIGHIYFLQGKLDDAQVYWEQGLNLRKTIGEESGVILSLQNMGFLQMAQGNLDKATKSFLEALDQSRSIAFENAIAVSLGNLGTIYQRQGRYKAALDSYGDAIQVLRKLNDKKGIAEYTKFSGIVYLELLMLQPAEEKLNEALKAAEGISAEEIIVETRILLAQMCRLKGDHSRCGVPLDEAILRAEASRYSKALLEGQIEKALLLAAEGKTHEASTLLEGLSKRSDSSTADVWVVLSREYARAKVALQRGLPESAAEICRRAIPLAETAGAQPYLMRFHSLAGEAYLALNSKEKAMVQFQKGVSALETIRGALPKDLAEGLMRIPEVKEIIRRSAEQKASLPPGK